MKLQVKTCRDCNRPVTWATTNKGRKVLLDAESDPSGSWYFATDGTALMATSPREIAEGLPHFHCHWDTCVDDARSTYPKKEER